MDICHIKKQLARQIVLDFKGHIFFRGDIVKDENSFFAVFTEQGASAFHMAATTRLLACQETAAKTLTQWVLTCRSLWPQPLSSLARTWFPPLGLVCHLLGGQNPGMVLKTLSVLFFSTFMAILWLSSFGKCTRSQLL